MPADQIPNPDQVRLPGIQMRLGVREYVLAPIVLDKFLELEDDFERLRPDAEHPFTTIGERVRSLAKFVRASLERNYDYVERSDGQRVLLTEAVLLSDLLDMGNREDALMAALAVSGLQQPGEQTPEPVSQSPSPASITA
jgi:hypothetical protein